MSVHTQLLYNVLYAMVFTLQVAYKLGKPILLPSWVEDCWNRTLTTSEVLHATEEVQLYVLIPFKHRRKVDDLPSKTTVMS